MTRDVKIRDYLDSLDPGNDTVTEEIRREAVLDDVPVMRRDTEALLKTVIAMIRPRRILEVGAGAGYSAIVMAEAAPEAEITTIENWPPRITAAGKNIDRAGLTGRIVLLD